MAKWGEIKCPRCSELEAQITAMEEGLTAVHMAGYMDGKKAAEAKLAQQDDLVHAAVAAALREAAGIASYHTDWGDAQSAILALITDDAQAALDRVLAAERERIVSIYRELSTGSAVGAGDGHTFAVRYVDPEQFAAAIRKGGK